MSERFDPSVPAIVVAALLAGPREHTRVQLTVDTGATRTLIRATILERVGYRLTGSARRIRVRSATGAGVGIPVSVTRFEALDIVRTDFPVVAHEFPPAVIIDGLLGLDFFRGHVLTLDFHRGRIDLRPPRPRWQFWR